MHMLRDLQDISPYTLRAHDGEVGRFDEVYFDEEGWTVRYFLVRASPSCPGRPVLISPIALGAIDDGRAEIPVALTVHQIRRAPSLEGGRRITAKYEIEYHRYYGWPPYWNGSERWGLRPFPASSFAPELLEDPVRDFAVPSRILRRVRDVVGCIVQARDGRIGDVESVIVDDESWEIRYLVVGAERQGERRRVLVAPDWIGQVGWTDRSIATDLLRALVRQAPPYDPRSVINREFERRLYEHHGRGYPPDAARRPRREPAENAERGELVSVK